ncbi:hypothetical protein PG993_000338 [Apiospora rasikravindrae]|uniref:Uncharacterized protein n=1 Tax=Apiospora rasikravindrae TaxID=990691 RepID=A0ABR1U8A5_9PEZI
MAMPAEYHYTALAQELEEAGRETDRLRAEVAECTVALTDAMRKVAQLRACHHELGESVDMLCDVAQWLQLEMHDMDATLVRHNVRNRQLQEEVKGSGRAGRTGGGVTRTEEEDAT